MSKRWRKLSSVRQPGNGFAGCFICGEVFIDDERMHGSLICPCGKGTLIRGMTLERAKKFKTYPGNWINPSDMSLNQPEEAVE